MNLKAIGLSMAGLLITGGMLVGATGAHADAASPGPMRAGDDVAYQPTNSPVTTSERAQVAAAIQQHDAGITVHAVRRGPDGTFHALGSKAGEPVLAEVSKNHQRVSLQARPGS
jgi:hypothetical protein